MSEKHLATSSTSSPCGHLDGRSMAGELLLATNLTVSFAQGPSGWAPVSWRGRHMPCCWVHRQCFMPLPPEDLAQKKTTAEFSWSLLSSHVGALYKENESRHQVLHCSVMIKIYRAKILFQIAPVRRHQRGILATLSAITNKSDEFRVDSFFSNFSAYYR